MITSEKLTECHFDEAKRGEILPPYKSFWVWIKKISRRKLLEMTSDFLEVFYDKFVKFLGGLNSG